MWLCNYRCALYAVDVRQVDAVIQLLVRAGNARLLLLRNAGANQMRVNVVGRYQCLANFASILGETWRDLFFESLIRFEMLDYLFESLSIRA